MKLETIKKELEGLKPTQKKELISYLKNGFDIFNNYLNVSSCPYCNSKSFFKNGSRNGITRHFCKECGKTFTYKTNTILSGVKKTNKWNVFVEDFVSLNILNTLSLKDISTKFEISEQTVINWRNKILNVLQKKEYTKNKSVISKETDIHFKKNKVSRPGRDIRIGRTSSLNKNTTGKIGTIDNKNYPKTVYVYVGFWVDVKNKQDKWKYNLTGFDKDISRQFEKELKNIYKEYLTPILKGNKLFPFFNENIYTYDFPVNLNYNKKRSFVSIELTLDTINCIEGNKEQYILKNKPNNKLFTELKKIYDTIITSNLLLGKNENFEVFGAKK